MNFTIQYRLPDSTETRNVVVEDCENVAQALEKFAEKFGGESASRVLSVWPAVGLM